jgi:hypothetical protein
LFAERSVTNIFEDAFPDANNSTLVINVPEAVFNGLIEVIPPYLYKYNVAVLEFAAFANV